jgi:demethylmenaquinone methyltransferase/2-methoxy-6-polyprenyl-1,4-benzoquinol methylase
VTEATPTLSHAEAQRFYDRLGSVQDWQWPFEQPAREKMVEQMALGDAAAVFELGCGTGRFAKDLLERHLPIEARYLAVDVSDTMLRLSRRSLERFGPRVEVRPSGGSLRFVAADGGFDRWISTYVLDLLSESDIALALSEAQRLLKPGGRIGLVSLTHGATPLAQRIERIWLALHRRAPAWTGGCRPLALASHLDPDAWAVRHHEVVTSLGISSEVVVAERVGA